MDWYGMIIRRTGPKELCDLPHVPESLDGTHDMLHDVIDFGGSCKATDAKP